MMQPVIPSFTTSNSISCSTGNREEGIAKEESSQSFGEDYPFRQNEQTVSYIPFYPQEIFNASSFTPTAIYTNPFLGIGHNQNG